MATRLSRLIELNKKLTNVVEFAYGDDDDEKKRHGVRNTALLGGAGLAGAAGLYAKGARMQGVQWSNMAGNLGRRVSADGISPVASRVAAGSKAAYAGGKAAYKGTLSAIESLLAKLRK